jgi:hypothetical protein
MHTLYFSKRNEFSFTKLISVLSLVILVLIAISRVLSLPEVYRAFFSIPLFFLIPFIIGHYALVVMKHKSDGILNIGLAAIIMVKWSIGIICLSLSYFLLSFIHLPAAVIISTSSVVLIIIFIAFSLQQRNKDVINVKNSTLIWFFITIIAGGLLPFAYIRLRSVFPYQLGRDFADHIIKIRDIERGIYLPRIFDDCFEELILTITMIGDLDPLSIFWAAPLLQYILFSSGIFILTYKLNKSCLLSFLSAIISSWGFGGTMVMDMIFLLRRNMLMALLPFTINVLYDSFSDNEISSNSEKLIRHKKVLIIFYIFPLVVPFLFSNYSFFCQYGQYVPQIARFIIWPIFSINPSDAYIGGDFSKLQDIYSLTLSVLTFIIMRKWLNMERISVITTILFVVAISYYSLHYMMGFVTSVLLFLIIPISQAMKNRIILISRISSLIVGLYLLLNMTPKLLPSSLILEQINQIFTLFNVLYYNPSAYNFPFDWKKSFLEGTFGSRFAWLFLISVVLFPFSSPIFFIRDLMSLLHTFTCISIIAYFAPLPFSYRFLVYFAPFVGYFSVLIIFQAIKRIFKFSLRVRFCSHAFVFPASALLVLLALSLPLSSITSPYDTYIKYYSKIYYTPETGLSSFFEQDVEVAKILSESFPRDSILITDPHTLVIISALSGLTETYNERIYTSPTTTAPLYDAREDLFKQILTNFSYKSLQGFLEYFPHSSKKQVIIIINFRTSSWVNSDKEYPGLKPFRAFPGFENLLNDPCIEKIYDKNDYYVFKINLAHADSKGSTRDR